MRVELHAVDSMIPLTTPVWIQAVMEPHLALDMPWVVVHTVKRWPAQETTAKDTRMQMVGASHDVSF